MPSHYTVKEYELSIAGLYVLLDVEVTVHPGTGNLSFTYLDILTSKPEEDGYRQLSPAELQDFIVQYGASLNERVEELYNDDICDHYQQYFERVQERRF